MNEPTPPLSANRDTILAALNELLEAERAGAHVALRTAKELSDSALNGLVSAIQRDEAHWCDVLTRAIVELDSVPSNKIGAFCDKAMAIADIPSRLSFLNHGQNWVVRRLNALLPIIGDGRIHDELNEMLLSHERNIALVASRLETTSAPPAQSCS
jgi:hypothetical protein